MIRIILDSGIRLRLVPIIESEIRNGLQVTATRIGLIDGRACPQTCFPSSPTASKSNLREQGARHDLVDAVLRPRRPGTIWVLVVRRIQARTSFSRPRTARICSPATSVPPTSSAIEEKKDAREYVGKPDPQFYRQAEEWELAKTIDIVRQEAGRRDCAARTSPSHAGDGEAAAPMWMPSSTMVTVNVDDPPLRENRLPPAQRKSARTRSVADFSKIEGS